MKKYPRIVAVAIIVAATFLVYAPALRNGFVWDDTALVLRDPLIRSWRLIPEGFRHFLFLDATASDFYRPVQRLIFTLDYALFGFDAPWGWHLTSICIHAAAAVALFFLARLLLRGESADRWALGVAVVWAVHPLHTSAVTYIAGRADPLAALFGFTALVAATSSSQVVRAASRRAGPSGGDAAGTTDGEDAAATTPRRAGLATFAAAVCFLAALLSKESGFGPLLIWVLILAWRRVSWKIATRWLAIVALVLGSYLALRGAAEHTPPPPPPRISLPIRAEFAARAFAECAGLVILPRTLRMERDVARSGRGQTLLGVLLLGSTAAWWRWARRRVPDAAWALGAFGVAYLPISGLFSLNATVAEHWLYVPTAFLLLAAALSAQNIRCPRNAVLVGIAGWVAFLGARTFLRQQDWRDQRTFLERTIADGGDTARMHINLGNLELQEGRAALALGHYRRALDRAPEQPMAWLALARFGVRTRDFTDARQALEHAATPPLLAPEILQTRAALEYLETGRDSGDLLRQAVALAPKSWPIRRHHLEHLEESGRTAEAARELREFLSTQPFRAESWAMLGAELAKLGQHDAAAAMCQARRLDVRLK